MYLRGQSVPVVDRTAYRLRTVDVDVGFTQNARRFERSNRIAAHTVIKLCADSNRDLDRSERLVFDNGDACDIANVYPAEPHRGSDSQPLRIVEVGLEIEPGSEKTRCTGHQEQQKSECQAGNNDGDPNPQ